MKDKDKNLIYWIIGIVFFLIVVTKLPLIPQFALVTTTVCADGVTNYYPLDGTLVDMKGGLDITNNGAIFVGGKLGSGALEFNVTDSISFPTLPLNLSVGFWINNYSNIDGWIYKTYEDTSILSSTAFLGLNGSVDEIVVGTNISGFSNIQPCYLTVYEENISCKDYLTSQVIDPGTGCLNFSGEFFPNCEYSWETTSGYYVSGNECFKRFYCNEIIGTDFSSLTLCQDSLVVEEEPVNDTITAPPYIPPTETLKDKLNQEVFEVAGFKVTLLYLIIGLITIIIILWAAGVFGKK